MVALATTTHLPPLSPEDQHLLERYIHHNEKLDLLAAELAKKTGDSYLPLPPPAGGGRGEGALRPPHATDSSSSNSALSPQHSVLTPSPLSLLLWTASPNIAPYISLYRNHITHLDKREAIEVLKSLMRASEDPVEKRRAATTLLRALTNQLHPTKSRGQSEPTGPSRQPSRNKPDEALDPSDEDILDEAADDADLDDNDAESTQSSALSPHHSDFSPQLSPHSSLPTPHSPPTLSNKNPDPNAPFHPKNAFPIMPIVEAFADKLGQIDSVPFAPLPDPCRAPSDVALLVLNAIKTPDHPTDGAGPRILFNLQGYLLDRSIAEFNEYKNNYLRNVVGPSWNHLDAELHQVSTSADRAKFLAWLTLADGRIGPLNIELERIPAGVLKDCWVINHLFFDHRSPGKPAPPNRPPDPALQASQPVCFNPVSP